MQLNMCTQTVTCRGAHMATPSWVSRHTARCSRVSSHGAPRLHTATLDESPSGLFAGPHLWGASCVALKVIGLTCLFHSTLIERCKSRMS